MFELQQAAVGYDAVPILQNVSFTAQDGQITTLVGTNGCGKTTLLKAIARQLPLLGGQILLQGRSIQDYERKEFARTAAFMPQVRNIPEITVRGLVSHGRFPYLGLSRQMTTKDRKAVEEAMQVSVVKTIRRNLTCPCAMPHKRISRCSRWVTSRCVSPFRPVWLMGRSLS